MMSKQDDGGPAFPVHDLSGYGIGPLSSADGLRYEVFGMSLRDWFAGRVLSAFDVGMSSATPEDLAHHAFRIADAMLDARKAES